MEYLHDTRAGNPGDVHKHVCLLSVLDAILPPPPPATEKEGAGGGPSASCSKRALRYVETHSGSGRYGATSDGAEGRGVGRLLARSAGGDSSGELASPELRAYAEAVRSYRRDSGKDGGNDDGGNGSGKRAYPGSPLLAVGRLRPGLDSAVLAETQPSVAEELGRSVDGDAAAGGIDVSVEVGDGYDVLRRLLAPPSSPPASDADDTVVSDGTSVTTAVLIDPPYVDTLKELDMAAEAVSDCLRICDDKSERGAGGVVVMVWYPIKEGQDGLVRSWRDGLVQAVRKSAASQSPTEVGANGDDDDRHGGCLMRGRVLFGEVWTKPRFGLTGGDGGAGTTLVGSGVAVVHPPDGMDERMRKWTAELHGILDPDDLGSWSVVLM